MVVLIYFRGAPRRNTGRYPLSATLLVKDALLTAQLPIDNECETVFSLILYFYTY